MNSPAVKYEVDKTTGAIFVDRMLKTAMYYPCNYGYVPHTLCGDGDLDDILLDQIVHFFEHYKDLERNKWVRTGGWKGVESARQELLDAISCYQSTPDKPNF